MTTENRMRVSYRDGLPACGLVVDLSAAEGGRLHACGGLRRLVQLQTQGENDRTQVKLIKIEEKRERFYLQ